MRLLTWNINALAGTVRNFELKHGSFRGFLDHHGIDILSVQEHKLSEDKVLKEQACVDGYESFWAFSTKKLGYSGVATWCKLGYSACAAEVDCLGSDSDDFWGEGRVVCTDHGHFVLINVYVPNAGGRPDRPRLATKLDFLSLLKAKADALTARGREVIIVGDLNVAATQADVHHQIVHAKCYNSDELAALSALTSTYTDVWRRLHPDVKDAFTVWDEYTSARVSNEGCRIDFVLVTPGLLDKVVSCEHLYSTPPKWSDHAGVMLELRGLEETPVAKPCPLSSRCWKRFNDRSQPSIASIFGRKRPADAPPGGAAAPLAKQLVAAASGIAAPPAEQHVSATADAAAAPSAQQPAAAAADSSAASPAEPLAPPTASSSGNHCEGGGAAAAAEAAITGACLSAAETASGGGPAAEEQPVEASAGDRRQNGASAPAACASSTVSPGRGVMGKGSRAAGRGRGARPSNSGAGRGRKQPPATGKASIQSFFALKRKAAD